MRSQGSEGRAGERKIILDHRAEGDQRPRSYRFSQIGGDWCRGLPEQRANVVVPGRKHRVVVVKDGVGGMQDQRGLIQQGNEVTAKEQERTRMEIELERARRMGANIEGRVDDAPWNASLCRYELRHPRTKQGGDEEVGFLFVQQALHGRHQFLRPHRQVPLGQFSLCGEGKTLTLLAKGDQTRTNSCSGEAPSVSMPMPLKAAATVVSPKKTR